MSTQNLSSAALHVIGQYNDAGKTLVIAYRSGVHRLLGGAASRCSDFIGERELPFVGQDVKARLQGTQEKVSGLLATRLDTDTRRAIVLMDRLAESASNGVESIAKAAARAEAPLGASIVSVISRLQQPGADLSVKLADKIAAGAKKVERRFAGVPKASRDEAPARSQATARRATRARKA